MTTRNPKRPPGARPARRRSDARVAPAPATSREPLPYLPPRDWLIAHARNHLLPELREIGAHWTADQVELLVRLAEDEDRLEAQRAALLQ